MNSTVLIFSEIPSNRLQYVCRLVFTQHLGLDFSITCDRDVFTAWAGAKLLYCNVPNGKDLHIVPDILLFETGTGKKQINTCVHEGVNVPFATGGQSLPFDVFAAIFYLVSRYEEYLPFTQNQYGQFKAAEALASQLGFLNKPVVDIWVLQMKILLERKFPYLVFKQQQFRATFTYDIDVAYAYLGRTAAVTAANCIRDGLKGNFKRLKERLRVMRKTQKDPFDTYDHILQQKSLYGHDILFFFLLGPRHKFNRNLPPNQHHQQQLIATLAANEPAGIHPSYFADTDAALLQKEKQLLETICHKKITSSRQHYLRLSLPVTYNNLTRAGITDDYTMGFAEQPGFRAGTCTAFNFYDLLTETETGLVIHPHTFMEGTFIEDMQLPVTATLPKMTALVDEVKKVNGHFISIWHNHSLCNQNEWKGLREVHDSLAAYARLQQ